MSRTVLVAASAVLSVGAFVRTASAGADEKPPAAPSAPALSETTYTVRHQMAVKDLPADAKQVRIWFWMPEDTPEQKVLDFKIVEAPEGVRITRDATYGRSWIHADVAADPAKPPKIVTEFRLRRREVRGPADA